MKFMMFFSLESPWRPCKPWGAYRLLAPGECGTWIFFMHCWYRIRSPIRSIYGIQRWSKSTDVWWCLCSMPWLICGCELSAPVLPSILSSERARESTKESLRVMVYFLTQHSEVQRFGWLRQVAVRWGWLLSSFHPKLSLDNEANQPIPPLNSHVSPFSPWQRRVRIESAWNRSRWPQKTGAPKCVKSVIVEILSIINENEMYDKVVKSFCSPEDMLTFFWKNKENMEKASWLQDDAKGARSSVVSSLGVFLFHSGVSCCRAKQTYLAEWEIPKRGPKAEVQKSSQSDEVESVRVHRVPYVRMLKGVPRALVA